MVLQDNRPKVVLGSGGSNRIRTAILQVISNLIDFQMPLTAAVEAPRVHWENGTLHVEANQPIPDSTVSDELVYWSDRNMFFGGVHAVKASRQATSEKESIGEGKGDSRRSGAVCQS